MESFVFWWLNWDSDLAGVPPAYQPWIPGLAEAEVFCPGLAAASQFVPGLVAAQISAV